MAEPFPPRQTIKILSNNFHSCIGTDRRLKPERVAEVIAALEPDIIGLQELDIGRRRTGGVDQANIIASLLPRDVHFHSALHCAEERYGGALLTPHTIPHVTSGSPPPPRQHRGTQGTGDHMAT